MRTALYVLSVAGALLALTLVFGGLGVLLRRACGRRCRTAEDLLLAPWLGWGGAIVFLQLWNFFLPVDARCLALLSAAGAAGLVLHARPLARVVLAIKARTALAFGVPAVLILLVVANRSVNQPGVYDAGFYHLQSIRWARAYPVVPGLAHLCPLYAYNNSFFLYAALLDVGFFTHRSHQIASGLLISWTLLRGLAGWLRLRTDRPPGVVFDALMVVPTVYWAMENGYFSSPAPDVATFCLGLVVGAELLNRLGQRGSPDSPASDPGAAPRNDGGAWWRCDVGDGCLAVVFLCAVGVSNKLTFASLGGMAALLAVANASGVRRVGMRLALAAGVASIVLVPWMLRGVILSGYPAFPLPLAGFPVDWRISAETGRGLVDTVKAWARTPGVPAGQVLGTWSWVWPWAARILRFDRVDVVLPLALAGVAGWRACSSSGQPGRRVWWFLLAPLTSIACCLVSAPDPRYAGASFWLLSAGALAIVLSGEDPPVTQTASVLFAVVLAATQLNLADLAVVWHRDPGPARTVSMKSMTSRWGVKVGVPVSGDQCWDAPLPCTPYFNPDLRLRHPGDLGGGFTVQSPAPDAGHP